MKSFRDHKLHALSSDLVRLIGGNAGLQRAQVLGWNARRFGEYLSPAVLQGRLGPSITSSEVSNFMS